MSGAGFDYYNEAEIPDEGLCFFDWRKGFLTHANLTLNT
jgi:hypothetical protein